MNQESVRSRDIRWRRLLLESVAVVLSILLAFAIDAWWDGHKRDRQERALIDALLQDFESSRESLEGRLDLARRMAEGNAQMLELLELGEPGDTVLVPDSALLAVLGGPTYEPSTNSLDAAVASGHLGLLTSEALRIALAEWRRALADTSEDELEVRRITNEQVIPQLARSVNLAGPMDRVLEWSRGEAADSADTDPASATPEDTVSVQVSTELMGALAVRGFYVRFSAADLADLLQSLEAIVELLEAGGGAVRDDQG